MKKLINFILIFSTILMFSSLVAALPNGATVTNLTSTHANTTSAGNNSAIAGNVTELSIDGYAITQSWQGYFGNVTGTIMLADNGDNIMYNWPLASPKGEIYAANASSVAWEGIQCYDEVANMTFFESMFGISTADADGLNETFNLNDHAEFFTNNKQFTSGQCNSTKLYNSVGIGTFDEVLLTDGPSIVFASLLLEDADGFDSKPHDFEMMVLENGHGVDTDPTTYYFWVELE